MIRAPTPSFFLSRPGKLPPSAGSQESDPAAGSNNPKNGAPPPTPPTGFDENKGVRRFCFSRPNKTNKLQAPQNRKPDETRQFSETIPPHSARKPRIQEPQATKQSQS